MITPGPRLIAVRRTSVDAGSVAAVLATVLVVCALVSGVVASLPSIQQESLRSAMGQLPADDVVVEATSSYDAEATDEVDAEVRAALSPLVEVAGGAVVMQAETVAHEAEEGSTWTFSAFTSDDGVVRAVEGRVPEPSEGGAVEVAAPAAAAQGPGVGDVVRLVSPLDDEVVTAEVVGTWEPAGGAEAAFAQAAAGSLLVHEDDFPALAPRAASVRWRSAPDLDTLGPEHLEDLRAAAGAVDHDAVAAGERAGASVRVENPLVDVLAARSRELLAQRMLLLVPALLLLVLGAAAAVLVASALSENRRDDETLLRSRGADRRQLIAPTALEATVICLLGAVAGPLVAAAVVRIGGVRPELGTAAWAAGAAAGLVCWVALVLPVAARALGDDRGDQLSVERRRRRTLTGLIALALLMVALGVVAVVRLDGFAALVAAAGTSGQVDPLLVASPSLLLLSLVTVLALALLPVLFRLTEHGLRGRGVALAVGTRSVSRAPGKAVPLAVAVALVAGGITFATVERASQEAAREARAEYDAGADVRVLAPPPSLRAPAAEEQEALTGLPGVTEAVGLRRDLDFVDDVAAEVLVTDLGSAATSTLLETADDPDRLTERLTTVPADPVVPVALTDDLADAAALEVGSDVELTVGDTRAVLRVVGTLPLVPTVAEGRAGVLVDVDVLDARAPGALDDAPDEWWLAADRTSDAEAALADRPDLAAEVLTRDGMLARLAADPGTGGAALADVMTVTATGALLIGAVLLVSVVVLRRRERDQQTRFLRALGASERDVTTTLTTEYTLATGGGIVAGVVAGLVTASVALQATALGSGGRPLVPAAELVVPWGWTLLLLAVLLVMPMLALLGPARFGRRRDVSLADARARA